jgi:hypothetical protein
MTSITALREAITDFLAADSRFADVTITRRYPAARREYPLSRPAIAVGWDSLEAAPGFGGLLAAGREGDFLGAPCTASLRFDIFTPADSGDPHELLESLWEALLLEQNDWGFLSFDSGAVDWDTAVEANRLTTKGKLSLVLAREDATGVVGDFRVERV